MEFLPGEEQAKAVLAGILRRLADQVEAGEWETVDFKARMGYDQRPAPPWEETGRETAIVLRRGNPEGIGGSASEEEKCR